jgi:hypothetical protein
VELYIYRPRHPTLLLSPPPTTTQGSFTALLRAVDHRVCSERGTYCRYPGKKGVPWQRFVMVGSRFLLRLRYSLLRRAIEEGTLAYHVHNALRQLSQSTDFYTHTILYTYALTTLAKHSLSGRSMLRSFCDIRRWS